MRSPAISLVIGGLALGLAGTPAFAQQTNPEEGPPGAKSAPPQGAFPAAAIGFRSKKNGDYSTWVKLCEKPATPNSKEICLVRNETIDTNTGLPVIVAGARKIEGEAKEQLVVQTALLAVATGVRVNIDGGEPVMLVDIHCYGETCEAQGELSKELLGKLRQGKQMVTFVNLPGRALALPVNLAGFAKAYDGPSIDAGKYAEARAKLIHLMRQRQVELAAQAKGSQPSSSPSAGEGPSPSQPQPVYPDGPPSTTPTP